MQKVTSVPTTSTLFECSFSEVEAIVNNKRRSLLADAVTVTIRERECLQTDNYTSGLIYNQNCILGSDCHKFNKSKKKKKRYTIF